MTQYYTYSIWTSTFTLPTIFPLGLGPGELYSTVAPVVETGTAVLAVVSSLGNAPITSEVVLPPLQKERFMREQRAKEQRMHREEAMNGQAGEEEGGRDVNEDAGEKEPTKVADLPAIVKRTEPEMPREERRIPHVRHWLPRWNMMH